MNKINPLTKNLQDIYKVAKTGISKENKAYLLDELEALAKSIEEWKAANPKENTQKKAS